MGGLIVGRTVDIVEDRGGEPAPCKPPEIMEVVALAEAHHEIALICSHRQGLAACRIVCRPRPRCSGCSQAGNDEGAASSAIGAAVDSHGTRTVGSFELAT